LAEQAYAYVTLIPVAKGFQKTIAKELGGTNNVGKMAGDKAGKGFGDGFSRGLKTAGLAAATAAALGAVAAGKFFSDAVSKASALNESINAVNVAYGAFASDVLALGDGVASRLGLTQVDFNQAAVRFSGFADTIAGSSGDVAGVVDQLTTRAADFASVFNIEVSEALRLFQSGLAGEAEPLRRFGINLLESEVNAFALANGIGEVGRELTAGEKTQARYGLLMEETAKTQGDFANTSDQLANSQRIIKAEFADMSAELGMDLLPAVQDIVNIFAQDFMPVFKELAEYTAPLVRSVLEGVADIMRAAQDPTSFFGQAVGNLRDSFQTLIEVMAPADDQIEGTIDILGSLANLLSVLMDIISSFTAFVSTIGPAFEALNNGDFQTFFSWLSSDPIEWRRLNVTTAYTETGPRPMLFPSVDVRGIEDSFTRQARTGFASTPRVPAVTPPATQNMTEDAKKLIRDTNQALREAQTEYRQTVKELQDDFRETQLEIAEAYDDTVFNATKRFNEQSATIVKRYNEQIAEATKRRDESLAKALDDHTKRMAQIQKDFAKQQADLIQQSMDRLRSAYASAISVNVASIFNSNEIAGRVDGLVQTLRDRLIGARQLIANAAALASAGFSQTFIEQVVAAGPEVGNELAQSILDSTPETQAELKSLFGSIESEAETGMDALAQQIYDKTGLATTELKRLYAESEQALADSLLAQEELYKETQAEILAQFSESVTQAQATMDAALLEAQEALDEAILAAKEARDKALVKAQEKLDEALIKANEKFLKDIERIEKAFKSKIDSMLGKIRGLANEISAVAAQIASLESGATSRINALRPATAMAKGGLVTGPTRALIGEAGPELVIPLDRFESMAGIGGGGPSVNYYAAPNNSLDSEQELFMAMRRAKVVANW
jgi:hypothetical protein